MKIGLKLVSGFLVVAILVGVVGLISVDTSQEELQKSIGKSSVSLAIEVLDKIDRGIYNRIEEFQEYSKDLLLQETVSASNQEFEQLDNIQEYIDKKDREWTSAPKEEITPFMQELINNELSRGLREKINFYEKEYGYRVYGEIFVTNKYGANVAQTGKTSDYYQADEEWWQVAKRDGLYVADVEYDENVDIYSIDIGIRIDDENGNFLGVIKIVLNIEEAIDTIKEAEVIEKHETMHFKLIDKEGKLIYSVRDFELFKDVFDEEFFKKITDNSGFFVTTEKYISGEKEELFGYTHSKGYREFKGLGWILVAEHDTKEAFAPVTEMRNSIIIVSFVSLILAILIGIFISRSISKPIKKLTKIIEDISMGKLGVEIDPKLKESKDEIGKLSQAFDRTIVSLKLAMKKAGSSSEQKEETK